MNQTLFSLVPQTPALEALAAKARTFMQSAKAPSTLEAYNSDFLDFSSFCTVHGLVALPSQPETVALYIVDRADSLAAATLSRRLTAINQLHRAEGFCSAPASTKHFIVGETLKGIRRTIGTAQTGKSPLLTTAIRTMIRCTPDRLIGVRDRALILTGFAGAFRRNELAAITTADLIFDENGLTITVRHSKTDQESAGRKVGVPWGDNAATCPVRAMQQWLAESRITTGPVFRAVDRHGNLSAHSLALDSIARIIQRAASRSGINADDLGAHSLRSGFVSQATINGASVAAIRHQTSHVTDKSVETYRKLRCPFVANAANSLQL